MTALLREGLRELGLDESRAETLERFAALLLKKNEVMNLTAITEPEAVAQLHLLDSAALTRFVDLSGKTVVDVGTGAGFPERGEIPRRLGGHGLPRRDRRPRV
mgnify:CR=1 FL=1